ncbi:MAG: PH domain-containing protein [Armatimonadetes bacterium]|nr:PH domain-containing protein [Armatimonadota bacterium]
MRRLDPRSVLVLSIEWLRKAVYPMVIAVFANSGPMMRKGIEGKTLLLVLAVPVLFGALAIIGGIVSYVVTSFGIVAGSLIVSKRGIWRQERTIPLERVQNVHITQGLLERILGIATVRVETASGPGVEANLKSLSLSDARHIKDELLRTGPVVSPEASEPAAVYRPGFKDIVLAGALQNRALIVMAAILGVFGQGLDDLAVSGVRWIERSPVTQSASKNPVLFGTFFVIGGLLFVVFGWFLSILYAVFVYYGFKVVRTEKGLQVSYGLVNTVQTVIPVKRVQSVQTRASWLFKALGLNQLYVQSIGGHVASGEQRHVAVGQTLLAPVCRPQVLRTLLRLIDPALDVDKATFLASDRFLLRRRVFRSVFWTTLTILAVSVEARMMFHKVDWVWPIVLGSTFVVLLVFLSVMSYRRQGYAVTPEVFMVCQGTLGQNVTIIPVTNVQVVELTSDWFQRRRGLVDLRVMTPVSVAVVPCLARSVAESVQEDLQSSTFRYGRKGL